MAVRIIPYSTTGGPDNGPNPRVETGAVQFGKDWPGLFIRGDNAAWLAHNIGVIQDWYRSLPEEQKGADFGVTMAFSNLGEIMQTVREEVIVK